MTILLSQETGGSGGPFTAIWSMGNPMGIGQHFRLGSTSEVGKVSGQFRDQSSSVLSGTLTAYLHTKSGNFPGTLLATSNGVSVTGMTTSFQWYDFTFPSPPTLNSGTDYYIVWRATSVSPAGLQLFQEGSNANPYANGALAFDYGGNGVWDDYFTGWDVTFRLHTPDASIPTNVTGVVTVPNTGGTITLTQDMTVTATGELTLAVAEVGNLAGGKTITVQPGGKIKLTAGRQVTVLAGTLYKLLT